MSGPTLPVAQVASTNGVAGKVGPDIHVKVGPALYSVPWRLIGQQVHARSTATMVQVVHEGQVVATHVRRERGRSTTVAHYPPERIAFHMRTPTWCRHAAQEVGPSCGEVIATLLEINALFRLRAAQDALGLRTKHSPTRLEAACAKAIAVGDPSYAHHQGHPAGRHRNRRRDRATRRPGSRGPRLPTRPARAIRTPRRRRRPGCDPAAAHPGDRHR